MGAGTVELFVAEGARVVIAARGEEAGQALADRLGENAIFKRTDVSVEADVQALVDATMEKWGRVDVLFNNAGIGQGFVPPEEFTLEDFNRVMMTNLGSCFLGLKYVTPIMKKAGRRQHHQQRQHSRSDDRWLRSALFREQSGSHPYHQGLGHSVGRIRGACQLHLPRCHRRPHFLGRPPYPIGRGKRAPDPTADRILCKSVTAQSCRYAGRHCLRRVVFGQ